MMRSFIIVLVAVTASRARRAGADRAGQRERPLQLLDRAGRHAAARHAHRRRSRSAPSRRPAGPATRCRTSGTALENEIARLQRENGALKKDMLARNLPLPGGVAGAPPTAASASCNLKVPLPSDAEIDRVMSAFEKMWRRLVDMMQKTPGSDKI